MPTSEAIARLEAAAAEVHVLVAQKQYAEAIQTGFFARAAWRRAGGARAAEAVINYAMATAHTAQAEYCAAIHLLRFAPHTPDDPPPSNVGTAAADRFDEMGLCQWYSGDCDAAIQAFDQAAQALAGVEDQKRTARNRFYRGQALLGSGELEDATKELQEARSLDPDSLQIRGVFAQCLAASGDIAGAREVLRGTAYANDGEVQRAWAMVHHATGSWNDAVKALQRAWESYQVKLCPMHPMLGAVRYLEAVVSLGQGDLDRARRSFEDARAIWLAKLGGAHPWVEGLDPMFEHIAQAQHGRTPERAPGPWDKWDAEWRRALAACARRNGQLMELEIRDPATQSRVEAVERQLGRHLPQTFRRVLTEFSAKVRLAWFLNDKSEGGVPAAFREIFRGSMEWDLDGLLAIHEQYLHWGDYLGEFEDWTPWRNRLAFLAVGNGDYLTIDLATPDGPVVYFDHERDEHHGKVLAPNFLEFVERATRLGCVGPESWQYAAFLGDGGLDPDGANANEWREWFG